MTTRRQDAGSGDRLHDPARVAAISRTGLLNLPPDEAFDRLTRMAAAMLDVPIALISLVTDTRQFFASSVGLPAEIDATRETPLSHSFCQYVVEDDAPLHVSDLREDDRLKDNPSIAEFGAIAYSGVPLRLPDGNVPGAFCVIDTRPRMFTPEQKQLLADLAEIASREIASRLPTEARMQPPGRLSYLLDLLPVGLYIADRRGRLVYYNRLAQEIWGTRIALGTPDNEAFAARRLFDPAGLPIESSAMPLALALAGEPAGERELVLGEGTERRTIMFNVGLVTDPDGGITGGVCIMHDITTIRRASNLRDELLALVSHELRTPLTIINGMSGFLSHAPDSLPKETRDSALADIFQAGQRMERMVENMLLLSRLEHEAAETEPILVREAIASAMERHFYDFPGSEVEIIGTRPRDLAVRAVPAWIHLILVNLLRNAEQYGDHKMPHILQAHNGSETATISICNSGKPLTPNEYETLIQPFYRGPETSVTVSGAGLGLTVAARLAEAQGGTLVAESWDAHDGTKVTLRLPALSLEE